MGPTVITSIISLSVINGCLVLSLDLHKIVEAVLFQVPEQRNQYYDITRGGWRVLASTTTNC